MIVYLKYISLFLFFLISGIISAFGQKVLVNKATPDYNTSPIEFSVTGNTTLVNYKIILDRKPNDAGSDFLYIAQNPSDEQVIPSATGTIPIGGGIISYSPLYPGTFICVIDKGVFPDNMAAAVYKPFEITSQNAEPFNSVPTFSTQSFDDFWNVVKNDPGVNSPSSGPGGNIVITDCTSGCPAGYIAKELSITVLSKTFKGRMMYPNTSGVKFPAIFWMGSFQQLSVPYTDLAYFNSTNSILISIDPRQVTDSDETLTYGGNFENPSSYIYRYAQAALYAMINHLYNNMASTVFDNSKGVGLFGTSQGGGMSLLLAGLNGSNNRIKALFLSNPALCEQKGYLNGKVSSFPDWVKIRSTGFDPAKVSAAARYFDAAVAASRITAPVYLYTSYLDFVTPTMASHAATNNLKGSLSVVHGTKSIHLHSYNGFWNGLPVAFFKKHLQSTELLSNTNYAYYFVDAGSNTATATISTPLNLAGSVKLNGTTYTGPIKWTWIQTYGSTGNVTFGNSTSLSTTATFSAAGTYRLKLEPNVYLNVDPNGVANTFHSFSDYIFVTVTGTSQPDFEVQNAGTPSPLVVAAGNAVTLTGTIIKNNGSTTTAASNVKFYLSTDILYNAGDVLLASYAMNSGLGSGLTLTIPNQNLTIPVTTISGKYYIIVKADADGVIAESNESNNEKETTQISVGPDYIVSIPGTVSPTTINAGASLTLSGAQIKNQGIATSTQSFVKFYLSTNQTYEPTDLQVGSPTGGVNVSGLLLSGTYTIPNQSLTIPAGTANGTYYIIVKADVPSAIAESNENNNEASTLAFTVGSVPACSPFLSDCANGGNNVKIYGCVLSIYAEILTNNIEYIKVFNSSYSQIGWLCDPYGNRVPNTPCTGIIPSMAVPAGIYNLEVKYNSNSGNPISCFVNNVVVSASFGGGNSGSQFKINNSANIEPDAINFSEDMATIFPNPTSGHMYLDLKIPSGQPVTVQIKNVMGQSLGNLEPINEYNGPILIKNDYLNAGIYFLEIQCNNQKITKRFIKN